MATAPSPQYCFCAYDIRRAIQHGVIKPCRVLRHVLVPATELDRLLKN